MVVAFSDLHTADGLKALEEFLAGKTYISGDAIRNDDIKVFAAVPSKPGAEFPNAARWYDTVAAAVASRFPGKAAGVNLSGAGASSAPAAAAPAAEAAKDAEDDDDLDLFGDETEEDKKAADERAASKVSTTSCGPSGRRLSRTGTSATPSATATRIVRPKYASMAETTESEYHTEEEEDMADEDGGTGSEGEEEEGGGKKRKRPLKSLDGLSKRGVCYLSRVPPHMNPSHVRQIFSKYGEVQRIYLVPEGQGHRKHANVRAKAYSEGWIEFAKKNVAKRVANLLNGKQIGGKKRSSFYYDIWNIKYLRKFKWDDLVGEIAEKTHIREQMLTLEITAAKKQRDHYLSNAEKSRTQKFIRERIKKKQKTEGKESNGVLETKIDRPIPQQKRPVEERGPKTKSKLSKNILVGVIVQPSGSNLLVVFILIFTNALTCFIAL